MITGRPGVGKTTIFKAIVERLKNSGLSVAGFFCPEVRAGGRRVGFKIVDIATGEEGWLAKVLGERCDIRVGRYCVVVDDALRVGLRALSSVSGADVLAIDELGPMELKIDKLRKAVIEALKESKAFIVVAHARLRDQKVMDVLREAEWFIVTESNRDMLRYELPEKVLNSLRGGQFG